MEKRGIDRKKGEEVTYGRGGGIVSKSHNFCVDRDQNPPDLTTHSLGI